MYLLIYYLSTIQDFRNLVSSDDFQHLQAFPYMKATEVDSFMKFIDSLGIDKIKAWWLHKLHNKWILPSIVKSLSKIYSEDWDICSATMNTGEGQHTWINQLTRIGLPLKEAVESYIPP
ncbi:hypothetical protein BDQ17DRAFT_1242741 [Cyathus striatus]|nr:hypothetical protein BDQ17DRAFT_1263211 [Cyathus striatus]KAF9002910.1 hypothetical protein BDQ17DRAFT_1242741 [Cyathus striatus]